MSAAHAVMGPRPPRLGTRSRFKFSLIDLVLTVVLVGLGLGPIRALVQTPQGAVLTALLSLIYLPFLAYGWYRLWTRPVSRFQGARRWLLLGFTAAILVCLMAIAAASFDLLKVAAVFF